MLLSLVSCLLLSAWAEEPSTAPPEAPEPFAPGYPDPAFAPFDLVLDRAKQVYFQGRPADALELLELLEKRLIMGEKPDRDVAAQALIYLGEIRYDRGEYVLARETFRQAVERDPDYEINPYHHPGEVVAQFRIVQDAVRASMVRTERPPPPPPPPPPLPLWGYAPGGIPQFRQGRPARGLMYLGLQGAFGLASLGTQAHLRSLNGTLFAPVEWDEDEYDRLVTRIQLERWLVQWPATFGFYFSWYLSVADGREQWREQPISPVDLGVVARPGGTSLRLSWRF